MLTRSAPVGLMGRERMVLGRVRAIVVTLGLLAWDASFLVPALEAHDDIDAKAVVPPVPPDAPTPPTWHGSNATCNAALKRSPTATSRRSTAGAGGESRARRAVTRRA
ncbi:MAG: hypothetical protein OHK0013_30680 [Sandaracinaceae bacterium]